MAYLTAKKAARLTAKAKEQKVSWCTKLRFSHDLKRAAKMGRSAHFFKSNYSNWKEIVKWLESLGYKCKVDSFNDKIFIDWEESNE